MKKLILILFLTPLCLHAEESYKRVLQIYRTNTEVDKRLDKNESKYTFEFVGSDYHEVPANVLYSINGKEFKQEVKDNAISIKSTPGKHIFQFFYSDNYFEVYSDSLEIDPQHHSTYTVVLFESPMLIEAEKPIIYLYPKEETEVVVKMDIHGGNKFLYPAYNDGWKFTAQPNGDLFFGDDQYNYLFWEATIRQTISPDQLSSGFFVENHSVVSFLEEKLTQAGLTSEEQADFITYWGPRLSKNKLNFVHFEFNETCEKYADIDISPKPDNFYRIYMIWGSVTEKHAAREQVIEPFNRDGFSVLEWGGQESQFKQASLVKL